MPSYDVVSVIYLTLTLGAARIIAETEPVRANICILPKALATHVREFD